MGLTLLPDLGDLLRLNPRCNAATLVEIVRFLGADGVLWLSAPDPEHPVRDALRAARLSVEDLAPDWAWAEREAAQLMEFLSQYPQGQARLREAARAEAPLREALAAPLDPARLVSPELLDAARAYHAGLRDALGEGPGTAHRAARLAELAARLAGRSGLALAPLDDVPDLLDLVADARLPDLAGFAPGEPSRLRALADRALRLEESDDPQALVDALARETGDAVTPPAELRYAAANIALATGDLAFARDLLEDAAHALGPDAPPTLPGLVLARLGQVRDAQGDRDLARRTYQAVLALSYAPAVALDTARTGLETPFALEA